MPYDGLMAEFAFSLLQYSWFAGTRTPMCRFVIFMFGLFVGTMETLEIKEVEFGKQTGQWKGQQSIRDESVNQRQGR